MPWSTWTTRSPTFRSRRSDRNALVADAAPLGRAPLLLEDVGFGVDLQAGVGQPEAARQRADRDQHRRVPRVVRALDRHREDVVFLEQLDRPLGAARRRRDEQRRLALVAQPPDLGDPVGDAALAARPPAGSGRDCSGVARRRLGRRRASSSRPSSASCVALRQPRFDQLPVGEQLGRRRRDRSLAAASASS